MGFVLYVWYPHITDLVPTKHHLICLAFTASRYGPNISPKMDLETRKPGKTRALLLTRTREHVLTCWHSHPPKQSAQPRASQGWFIHPARKEMHYQRR